MAVSQADAARESGQVFKCHPETVGRSKSLNFGLKQPGFHQGEVDSRGCLGLDPTRHLRLESINHGNGCSGSIDATLRGQHHLPRIDGLHSQVLLFKADLKV